MNEKICSHHVGGRSGTRAFPVLMRFESDFVNVLYDADPECAVQMETLLKDSASETKVLPYCLGGKRGNAVFNINYDPYTSSLLSLNPKKREWYFYFRKHQHDYILGETFKTIERQKMPVTTLDFVIRDQSIQPPDILSIDVQGTEWDVLRGAKRTLDRHTVAVIAEVEFHQLYKGQKLFGDVSALLQNQGFQFVKFKKYFTEFSPYRYPIGLRGEGFQGSSDALFFKDIASVKKEKNLKKRTLMFQKLAFIAIVFNQFEFALQCLKEISSELRNEPNELNYQALTRMFAQETARVPKVFPPTFKEEYTFAQSRERFNQEATLEEGKERVVSASSMKRASDSKIEKLFRKYDLSSQADLIKKMRLQQEKA